MKKILLLILAFFVMLSLNACNLEHPNEQVGNSDWSYELSNDYVIWHINSKKIVCGKKQSENSISNVGGDYIVKFCYNEQYICLQCIEILEDVTQDIKKLNLQFYVINTKNDEVYGPFSEQEYLKNISIENLSPWMDTKPMPEGAKFQ